MKASLPVEFSPWPHRLAVTLALATFPLIFLGSLVTTYKAGMAVRDWPNTFGYNMFLYPVQRWLGSGNFPLFIEHFHRLWASTVGLIAIAFVVVTQASKTPTWLKTMAWGALLLVILQGVLGGLRVLFDKRTVALIHGCVGPVFFAYATALTALTSRWWQQPQTLVPHPSDSEPPTAPNHLRLLRGAAFVGLAAYVQLCLGAYLRHVPIDAPPQAFRAVLLMHVALALVVLWQAWVLFFAIRSQAVKTPSSKAQLGRLPLMVACLVSLQVAAGAATYVSKYSFPAWLGSFTWAAHFVVLEKSFSQAATITFHVANGSLIVALQVLLALQIWRLWQLSVGSAKPIARSTDATASAQFFAIPQALGGAV